MPLEIDAATDASVVGHASAAVLPREAVVAITISDGPVSTNLLASATCSDNATAVEFSKFNFAYYVDPNPTASTKDFAFFYNHDKLGDTRPPLFRLMYIRHMDIPANPTPAETTLAHAWSKDLVTWRVDTTAFLHGQRAFPSDIERWDRLSVWAPSLVADAVRDSTFMFYTGVDRRNDQTIGYASTRDLDTCNTVWTRHPLPTWTTTQTRWAVQEKPGGNPREFRDPYVFPHPHPDSAGFYYMVLTAADSADKVAGVPYPQAVGLARNRDRHDLTRWLDYGYFASTAFPSTNFRSLEGPTMFPDKGVPPGWISMFSNKDGGMQSARFERQTPGLLPWVTSASSWSSPPENLFTYLSNGPTDSTVAGWQGTEYLSIGDNVQYLAGFGAEGVSHVFNGIPRFSNGAHLVQGIAISRMNWSGRNFTLGTGNVVSVDAAESPMSAVRMGCVEFRLDWNPDPDGVLWDMAADDKRVYPVGAFYRLGNSPVSLMGAVAPADGPPVASPTLSRTVVQVLDGTNPCRGTGVIHFALRKSASVNLQIFDMQGRRVVTLLNRSAQAAGEHEIPVNTSDWAPGCYFYRLQSGPDTATRKMLVLP